MTRRDSTDAAAPPKKRAVGSCASTPANLAPPPSSRDGSPNGPSTSAAWSASSSPSSSRDGSPQSRAVRCTRRPRRPRVSGPHRRRWGRALAWGGALAAALLVAVFVVRDGAPPATSPDGVTIEAARVVGFDAPSNPVAVLPTGVVVDASAVAVLPFAAAGDAALAEGLERDVVAALRTVPGLYVIADGAVQPYAATELEASEVGGLLGARGLVDAVVELVDGRVLVDARLRESATGATLWEARFDRSVDELRAVRDEMADHIAAAMLDSSLRRAGRARR